MQNLATIQRIGDVIAHPNADSLSIVSVLGWKVVTRLNEFSVNDLCVYICIDTVLPESNPNFEFLRNKNFRIKPIRLRGQSSNGICFPISILPPGEYTKGQDVTDILSVIHYEKPLATVLAGQAYGHLPGFLRMTDETNLRSYPDAIHELVARPYYITRKDDGSSGTMFMNNGEFGVCSRKIWLKEDPNNGFWRMVNKYKINEYLSKLYPNKNVAIQGEIVGPGVQKNPLGLTELEFHLFNLWMIDTREYGSYDDTKAFCDSANIPMVTLIDEGDSFNYSLDDLIKLSNSITYPNGKPAEGIVIRSKFPFHSEVLNILWSGKVMNELYDDKN